MSRRHQPNRNNKTDEPADQARNEKHIARSLSSLHHTLKTFFDHHVKSNSKEETERSPAYILNKKVYRWAAGYTIITLIIMIVNVCQWQLAKDTEHRQFRAYVGPEYGTFGIKCAACSEPLIPKDADTLFTEDSIIFSVKNFGITPAYRPANCMNLFAESSIEKIPGKIKAMLAKCDSRSRSIYDPTIWPGDARRRSWTIDDVRAVNLLYKGQAVGVFFNKMTYVDTFNILHTTYICRILIFKGKTVDFIGCNAGQESNYQDD